MQESSFGFVDQDKLDPWSLYLETRGGDRDPFGMDLATDLANSVIVFKIGRGLMHLMHPKNLNGYESRLNSVR
jgi:hypothetical protein